MKPRDIIDVKIEREKSKNMKVSLSFGSVSAVAGTAVAIVCAGPVSAAGVAIAITGVVGSAAYNGIANLYDESKINREFSDSVIEQYQDYVERTKDVRYENNILKAQINAEKKEKDMLGKRAQVLYENYAAERVRISGDIEGVLYESSSEDKDVIQERDENRTLKLLNSSLLRRNEELENQQSVLKDENKFLSDKVEELTVSLLEVREYIGMKDKKPKQNEENDRGRDSPRMR